MNESITRAAGAMHGQEISAADLERMIRGRRPHAAPAHDAVCAAVARCRERLHPGDEAARMSVCRPGIRVVNHRDPGPAQITLGSRLSHGTSAGMTGRQSRTKNRTIGTLGRRIRDRWGSARTDRSVRLPGEGRGRQGARPRHRAAAGTRASACRPSPSWLSPTAPAAQGVAARSPTSAPTTPTRSIFIACTGSTT